LLSTLLLDQVRQRLRYPHYSVQTEENYVASIHWFIRWHRVRHAERMGEQSTWERQQRGA
jgi:hypothetical protein